jgi:hypothetical protein
LRSGYYLRIPHRIVDVIFEFACSVLRRARSTRQRIFGNRLNGFRFSFGIIALKAGANEIAPRWHNQVLALSDGSLMAHPNAPLHQPFNFQRHPFSFCLADKRAVNFEDAQLYHVFN